MRELDDDTIIGAFRGWGSGAMTYVIANVLGRRWSTAVVRKHLQDMEARGIVERVPSSYRTQICWALKPPSRLINKEFQP